MRADFHSRYFKLGLTMFLAGGALIVLYIILNNFESFTDVINLVRGVFAPFVYGLVMAYLLCPVYNFIVRRAYRVMSPNFKTGKQAFRVARVLGTIVAILTLICVVGGVFALILPELLRSIFGLIQVIPERINELIIWAEETVGGDRHPEAAAAIESALIKIRDNVIDWSRDEFFPRIGTYMTQISQGLIITVKTVIDVFIGVIICVYFLNSKEMFKAQTKKFITATMNKEHSDELFEFAYYTNRTFGGFINGKLIDSLIMGILCFVVMNVLRLPYVVLVSTIVGVTNFIPFFGPFIGAIPAAIIIAFVNPVQAIYFLLMILVLQQIDGNIIGPKILGETTGIASFWVMFAIIVGGGLFGFAGMVFGVPVFAVLSYYVGKFVDKRLERKELPTDTGAYEEFNKYDINRKDIL